MDFGLLYIQNKAASQAAMGLGCFVFVICILVPYIICWAFVPLYLILLILGAIRGFKVENPAFTFLIPLAPFAAACVLCMFFWWAIPFIVNLANDLFETFRSIFIDDNSPIVFLKDEIPDEKCYLYFILFFGGSISSFFSIMSIACMEPLSSTKQYHKINTRSKWDNNDNRWREIWIERKFLKDGIGLSYVKPTYQAYKTYTEQKIAHNAKDFFFNELKDQFIDQRMIDRIWEDVEWMFGQNGNDRDYKLDSVRTRQEKIKSLCIRASIDFTPTIKKLRQQFKNGAITKEVAMKSLYADFKKWKTELDLPDIESRTVWKSICQKINLQPKQTYTKSKKRSH